ncbi:hypothetical protein ONQ62_26565, partial [Salmonella enterica subsp. enterica serovar Virginia]|nr:hypothetical protein [Salmonella enterica subsp. enterica serovar Virginia]
SLALAFVLYAASFPSVMDSLTAGTITVVFSSMIALMRPLKSLWAFATAMPEPECGGGHYNPNRYCPAESITAFHRYKFLILKRFA